MAKKGKIKVTQIGSANGTTDKQKQNLFGLGLKRMHQSRILEDSPAIRGMVTKVSHLVEVEEIKE